MQTALDFNCDLGEGGADDAGLLALISSANIACGFHAGDPARMRRTVAGCLQHGVAIGAHPSYCDREGFGRREQAIDADEIYALLLYQIGALDGITRAAGGRLHHVKPHGALYNRAARDRAVADAIAAAIRDHDPELILYGLADSALTAAGSAAGLAVAHEAFVERRYDADGQLSPRGLPDAVIEHVDDAAAQLHSLVNEQRLLTRSGEWLRIHADTVCLHGDRSDALAFARALRDAMLDQGVMIAAPDRRTLQGSSE